jgi:hypothetical protein
LLYRRRHVEERACGEEVPMAQWRARIELPVDAASAAVARVVVGELLRAWDLARFVDDAQLIASELVTNVYMHTPDADSVELELLGVAERVRVSVADGSTIKPVIKELDRRSYTGRGMRLVQAVSARWGADDFEGGKRVWVEVE